MKEMPARPSHHLRDFGGAHPFFGGSRIVSGDEIEADLETEITTVNPPIAQGWMVGLGAVAFIVALIGVNAWWIGGTSSEALGPEPRRCLSLAAGLRWCCSSPGASGGSSSMLTVYTSGAGPTAGFADRGFVSGRQTLFGRL